MCPPETRTIKSKLKIGVVAFQYLNENEIKCHLTLFKYLVSL